MNKELDILNLAIREVLSEREERALKSLLLNEEGYQNFLVKFLEVIIGKDESITLHQFLDLHNLSEKLPEFKNNTNEVIEQLAELAYKGSTSLIIDWLTTSENKIFSEHLAFLTETKKGITKLEREGLKKKLKNLDELHGLELSDDEIRIAVTLFERRELKQRLKKLEVSFLSIKEEKQNKFRYASLFALVIISSIILAVSIPKVRNYILNQLHEIFREEAPANDIKPGRISTNSVSTVFDSVVTRRDTIPKIANEFKLFSSAPNSKITRSTYERHFKYHSKSLHSAEGIWNLIIKFKGYGNISKAVCAIRKISENKFEMIYFNDDGSIHSFKNMYFIILEEEKYKLQIDNKITKYKISFSKNKVTYQITLPVSEFTLKPETPGEKVLCTFNGTKTKLY